MTKLYTLGQGLQGEGLKEVPVGYIHWISIKESGFPKKDASYLVFNNKYPDDDPRVDRWMDNKWFYNIRTNWSIPTHYYGPINRPKDSEDVLE